MAQSPCMSVRALRVPRCARQQPGLITTDRLRLRSQDVVEARLHLPLLVGHAQITDRLELGVPEQ